MIVPPDGVRASGKDAIRAAMEQVFSLDPTLRRKQPDGSRLVVLENTMTPA